MHYELLIDKGKDETIIKYLKKFDFVTIKKKVPASKKIVKTATLDYFGAMPDFDFDFDDLRKNKFRKNKTQW
jgi:hypothetical protein